MERIARKVAGLYDPKLALPPGAPIADRDPALTERVKRQAQLLADGKLDARDFIQRPEGDFKKMVRYLGPLVKKAGTLQELRLFDMDERGNERVYRYRGRFENGVLAIDATLDPSGKLSNLHMQPEAAWDSPLQPLS